MRLPRGESEKNRRQILEAAGRLFRGRGFDGVGVADLMKAAGFTHGGFYNHFSSKEELEAEASAAGIAQANAGLARTLCEPRGGGRRRYLREYLSKAHRDDPESGCTLGALAVDAGRKGPKVQARFAEAIETAAALLKKDLDGEGRKGRPAQRRARALQQLSGMVGALVLARAVAGADPALSDEILAAGRRGLR
jgi:TetR/AcrR family transcriptional repressor of nem operon